MDMIFPITQNRFYSPTLRFLRDGRIISVNEIKKKVIDNFHLSKSDLALRLPSVTETIFTNRFRWTKNDLLKFVGTKEHRSITNPESH